MNVEKQVLTILNQMTYTKLGLSLQAMQIKPLITIEEETISINLCAGFPSWTLQNALHPLEASLKSALPNYKTTIILDHFIKAHRTQLPGRGLRGVKNTIAIASGKGGVGKSTVTVNLAAALAREGAKVGILDADIYGPSIPLMLGKTAPVQVQDEHYLPVLAHGIQAMSIGYLTQGEPALIWRGPMLAKSLLQMLDITLWDKLDYLFIDLPPRYRRYSIEFGTKNSINGRGDCHYSPNSRYYGC